MYKTAQHHIDETSNLISHLLESVAFSSQKTIASVVLLLSTIPEFYGMYWATGNVPISITASCVSLVVVTLALREKPVKWTLPRFGMTIPVYRFWLFYIAQIGAGLTFIIAAGRFVDIALIVISSVGAVCSERIAVVMIAEAKERNRHRLQLAKDAIKLNELEQNSQLRIENKKAQFAAKWEVVEPTEPKSAESIQIDTIVTASSLAKGREKAAETVSNRVAERRDKLAVLLADNPKITNAQLAEQLEVSIGTIRSDKKVTQ